MFRLPSGLYFSACLGSLILSILCTCCSHFFWYCFISFTMFCAPVFSLIHWFFSLSNYDYYLFIKYYSPLNVSSLKCSSAGRYSCIHATYGTVTLYESSWWPVGTQLEFSLKLFTDRPPRTLVQSDSAICCMYTTVSSWRWALEARNMYRGIIFYE